MKKILKPTILIGLIISAIILIMLAPYHIYTLTLTEGVNTNFLKMKSSKRELLDGELVNLKTFSGIEGGEELFSLFHFSNFVSSFPINNPLYSMIPSIKIEQQRLKLGAVFQDSKGRELFSFMSERTTAFEMTEGEQKIFRLPYFKNYINKKTMEEVWRDIFSKKLSLPANTGKSFVESLSKLKEISYSDLVYNLYILYNRHLFFPKDVIKLQFDENKSIGIIELRPDQDDNKIEQIYFINNGFVYSFTIVTKIKSAASIAFRANVLRNIKFKLSSPDSAIALYAQYKNITYKNRIDQQGMIYLYLAWSHDLNNSNFMRVIIEFLERGKDNYKFLQPFYAYSLKKFGTNLSTDKTKILENAEQRLKRNMKVELDEEINQTAAEKNTKADTNFNTPEEKIKYNLDRAKEKQKNNQDSSVENKGVLSIE